MRLSALNAANAKTLEAARAGKADVSDPMQFPFLGYYEADIFECDPFLMFTNNDCPRALNILLGRSFEPGSMKIWCRLARTATGILDIGAHVGVYALAAASLRKDIKIHAFEPNPHAYSRLRMHKLLNKFDNIIEHTFAVGDKNQYVNFGWVIKPFLQISSGGGVGRAEGKGVESILVPMRMLDGSGMASVLGNKPLIKIDVEGGEALTFKGMKELLQLKPDIILETFSQASCDAINEQILPLGYQVYQIIEAEHRVVRQDKLIPCDPAKLDYNQFLTVRTPDEVSRILE